MTHRLYYTDAYAREFEAAVVGREDGGRRVYLDRTAFYPTSGGQPHDTGRLGGVEVVDVVDEEEGRIAHLLAAPLLAERATGEVDWARRLDHMQQHTGQHLLSAVLQERFGHRTVGVHFGRDTSTLDLEAASLEHPQVVEAERIANAIAGENRPVEVSFEDAREAQGLRRASARDGTLRIVTIRDLDRSACGGTHVRSTGEIGMISIRKVERAKRQVRVEFVCGGRAVRRARADLDLLASLARSFSAALDEVPALVDSQRAELRAAAASRRALEEALDDYRARDLYAGAAVTAGGTRVVVVRDDTVAVERLRGIGRAVAALPGAVFVGAGGTPASVLVAAADDAGVDAGAALKPVLQQVGGRGGGNARLAQGTVPSEALETAVDILIAALG